MGRKGQPGPAPCKSTPLESDMPEMPEICTETLAETENYMVYTAVEPDGEPSWHVELGTVSLHFFREEWAEFLGLLGRVERPGRIPRAE